DSLLRIFGSERISGLMQRLGMQEGEAIEHPWVTRAIENAQRKVEGRNFDIRKQLLEFDDVANDQRKVIYEQRNRLMDVEDISESVASIRRDLVNEAFAQHIPPESLEEQWDVSGLVESLEQQFGLKLPIEDWLANEDQLGEEKLRDRIQGEVEQLFAVKEATISAPVMRHLEKVVMLQVLDQQWKDHLAAMDYLRQGIHLRGYAQKNPKEEYKREAFQLFSDMLGRIKVDAMSLLARVQVQAESQIAAVESQQQAPREMHFLHPSVDASSAQDTAAEADEAVAATRPVVRNQPKVGRNEPCPCGSGKKYKHCHGKLA
ncbi:MAG: SEC-C domain-containing protein, partial [Pseudomonadota bacterium]